MNPFKRQTTDSTSPLSDGSAARYVFPRSSPFFASISHNPIALRDVLIDLETHARSES